MIHACNVLTHLGVTRAHSHAATQHDMACVALIADDVNYSEFLEVTAWALCRRMGRNFEAGCDASARN